MPPSNLSYQHNFERIHSIIPVQNQRVLVTGSVDFIGSTLANLPAADNDLITVVFNLAAPSSRNIHEEDP
jgi:hypothetical protein